MFGLDGTYRRQWGEEGIGDGQFDALNDITVMGEEVFVCDYHRVQVFGLDGMYRRQFGGRIVPTGIDVIGEEVFVVDDVNRINVYR